MNKTLTDTRTLYVCNLREMPNHARQLRPSHLVSLVAPDEQPATPPEVTTQHHLRVEIHDIYEPLCDHIAPTEAHIASFLDFLESWDGEKPLLLHCVAGISRSMAAALIAMSKSNHGSEHEAAHYLRLAAPHAHPNRKMIALADKILGRDGRLIAARQAMGSAEPVLSGPLVRVPVLDFMTSSTSQCGLVRTWN